MEGVGDLQDDSCESDKLARAQIASSAKSANKRGQNLDLPSPFLLPLR